MTTTQKTAALMAIIRAVVDTIRESGTLGAPGGVLYAALSSKGCTLNQFNQIMDAIVAAGEAKRDGDCYVTTEAN